MSSRKEQIRRIVARALAEAGDELPLTDTDSLVVSGRISSLDVVAILVALEESFGIEIHADEFDPLRFDSVDSIDELLEAASGN
ncbi:MAG TPA: acyl carrier protein [Candidatus Limnocylindrales bacterium]|nr:acyl carrier protein [Candidatus Limnocylindrales bacterium]